ncbi:MAG: hypothetical protein QOD98_3379 [Nocardioidaceae bacterium]|nr:hypothetical protein [Nocardioidaceae bacterium]
MRKLSLVLVAALSTTALGVVVAAPAHAKPPKPRAELVTKKVSASFASGKVTAGATVKNKGSKKAPASVAAFYLSADTRQSGDDTTLGTAAVGKIKPKKDKLVGGTFAVPSSVVPGAYHVVVCSDSGGAVRERKETNNCKGSTGTVTVTGSLTVSATAGTGGSVAASGVTGGSCAVTTCTFPTPGTGKVTFTPTPASSYRFGAWTGATCTGFTSGAGGAITFTNPTSNKSCTATFVKQVMVSWSIHVPATGMVAGVATNGTCTPSNPVTGAGDCLVDAGVGTVTLSATAVLPFTSWSGATCDGVTSGAGGVVMTFSAPSADKACIATFTI